MKQTIDNLFTVSYLIFGLFLVLVGVKDTAIYFFESVLYILIGGGLVVCALNVLINEMVGDLCE
jgi:hypothetical protein